MTIEAFTYCWTDHKTNMLYVGYHKGRQDDGYICSQPLFLEQYNKRPMDFTRMILAEGTAEDCHALEIAILKAADAKHSNRFYNQSDGSSPDFVCKGHTEETRKLMSVSRKGKIFTKDHKEKIGESQKGPLHHFYGKHHPKEWITNMSIRMQGENNPFWGGHHSKESNEKNKLAHLGKHHLEESKQKVSKSLLGNKRRAGTRHSLETRETMSKSHAGKIWITNGATATLLPKEMPIPEGFRRGRK